MEKHLQLKTHLLYVLVVIIFSSCKHDKDDNLTVPETPVVLFSSGFEINQQPDISGWTFMYDYYAGIMYDTLVSSTCPNGGNWALNLKAQKLHFSTAEKYLSGFNGTKDVTLSFYASLNSGQNSFTAALVQIRNGAEIHEEEINGGTWNNWQPFTLRDSVSMIATDSLCIRFKATGSTYESSDVLLDRILLEENQ